MSTLKIQNQIELLEAQQATIQNKIEKAMASLIKRKPNDEPFVHNILIEVSGKQTPVKGLDTYFDKVLGKRVLSYPQEVIEGKLYLAEDDYGFPFVNLKITNDSVQMGLLYCEQTGWIREFGDNCLFAWADIRFTFNSSATYHIVGQNKQGKPQMYYNQKINFDELIGLFRSNEEKLAILYEALVQEELGNADLSLSQAFGEEFFPVNIETPTYAKTIQQEA